MQINSTPVILTASGLEVNYGEQIVLNKASLSIHEGDRIGLVGRNGSGKSTFLKIISGEMTPDSGKVVKKRGLKLGYLPQEFSLDAGRNVYQNILEGAHDVIGLIKEYDKLPHHSERRQILEDQILHLDGWNLDTRIKIAMQSLNVPDGERDVRFLSGGEKRRVALCKAVISRPDLLILDEPTNHLDTESIEWTEEFLAGYSGTCLFVTHDRYFLDRIANRIVELSNGVFYSHAGNYTDYLINKSIRLENEEIEEKKRQGFLRRELEWVRRSPSARRTKSKSRLDNFNEVSQNSGIQKELDVELLIPPAPRLGKKVLNLVNLEKEINGQILFKELNILFEQGRKLGVVGKNGLGKTTLLKIILGELQQSGGKIEIGENTIFNYVDQSRLLLNEEKTVLEEIGEGSETVKFGDEKITVWKYMRRFLFTDDRINSKIERLSGGEKNRLLLAKIFKNGGNFLMLDEPTNDLDLPTLRILEEALIGFQGCLIIVSHDRYFLNRICSSILAFEGNGKVYLSEGDYDYYLEKRKERRMNDPSVNSSKERRGDTRVKVKVRKLTFKERLELESIEGKILAVEEEIEKTEAVFTLPDFYEKYAAQTNELNSKIEKLKEEVKRLYQRWQELEDIKNAGE